jgi:anti-anti-sigma regulatory factor
MKMQALAQTLTLSNRRSSAFAARTSQDEKTRATFAVHLIGNLDSEASEAMSSALWRLSETGNPSIVIVADSLRLRNFWEFRTLAETIQNLRILGRDVRISVSNPQLKAVLIDLHLEDAFAFGEVRADHRVLVGNPSLTNRRAS